MTTLDAIADLIPQARNVVAAHLNHTEVREFGWLREHCGEQVVAKLETQQVTGSFKVRGALFALSQLDAGVKVIAPSAGNHGLAVAWAARRFNLLADIVLPQNASPLKRERILGLGAGVVDVGSTVEEATEHARYLAHRTGSYFVSPYNDPFVVAGQATVALELLSDRPDLRTLLIPVGGGGLLGGALAARHFLGRDVRVLACEPAEFASMGASIRAGRVVRLGRRPTFADGLATNLEPGSITLDLAAGATGLSFCTLTEEEIAAACVALFNRESILAEGAGSTGVAAALRLREHELTGPVGTIVCGGNIHHTTFWGMTAFPFAEPRLIELADTLGRTVAAEPRRRVRTSAGVTAAGALPESVDEVAAADIAVPADLVASVGRYTAKTREMLDDLANLAGEQSLPLDGAMLDLVHKVNDVVGDHAVLGQEPDVALREQRTRVLSQLAVAARLAFEWRSPGYDQSSSLSAFDLGALASPGVNYARYEQPGVGELEQQLTSLLGISAETHAVLLTSSGMAAFALSTATAFSAAPCRSVLTAPYLYFEGMETLQYLLADRVAVAGSYDADEIAAEAAERDVDMVYADPLSNHPDQRMVDVERLASLMAGRPRSPWLVVDASMLPVSTAARVTAAMPDRAIYYESCSKYLQFGLDVTMAGMVVVPRALEPLARRVRRNLGLGLDRYGAELFPRYAPEQLDRRLTLMERSAERVAAALAAEVPADLFRVTFPGLAVHPDHALARRYGRSGSCVTLACVGRKLNRDQLDPIVDAALREAASRKVPLVKGVSFGFSTSRLSAASAMAEYAPPFLRLAVGPLSEAGCLELADVVRHAIGHGAGAWPR